MDKKSNTLVLALDIIGFVLLFIGAALIRFAKDEVISITGGFVLAAAVTILTLTRVVTK
ncbi:MAG TPA: hypothetical protein VJB94_02440 [Candidatus Nanoarchaeia archaeon]|nr:hypothetical protein [Candidatus Nanoarchaeia archaeon]